MSEPINSYRDLRVWQSAMTLAEECYRLTSIFPREGMFGLTSQIRRSAASIAANIAEGHGREQTRTFVQYLRMAQGSLKELETHLLLAERVKVADNTAVATAMEQCRALGKMLRALIRSLQRKADN
ncbi:MAG: four helix bundle protein [Xanthobacteraceae bacterium]